MRGITMRKQILIAVGAVVLVVAIVIGWYLLTQRRVGRRIARQEPTHVLLLGTDAVDATSRSDSIMVLSVAPERGVSLLAFPPDLRVKFCDGTFHKLNAAFALLGDTGACETVSALLGIDVPFLISIGDEGFERLIDEVGGVTVTVGERMRYDDESADPPLYIDIQPGIQILDGKTALDYIRFPGETGDLSRIVRQQQLFSAVLEKGVQQKDLASIRALVKAVYPYMQTDLSLMDLYDLARLLQGTDPSELQMATVPGIPVVIDEIAYLEPQVVEMERLVARLLKRIDLLTPQGIRVAVFNGNGVRMMAQIGDVADPADLEIGMPVRLEFRRIFSDGEAGVIFYGHKAVTA